MKYSYALLILIIFTVTEILYAEENTFNVGVLLCLSGECSEWGDASRKGLMLAQEEINSRGGVLGKKIKLTVEDTEEGVSAKNAVAAFKKLTSSKISFFIGPTWTPASMALSPLLVKNKKLLMISPSVGIASFNETSENIFNTMPHSEAITRLLARHILNSGVVKIGIFSSLQPWEKLMGDIFQDEFEKGGGKVIHKIETDPTLRNLRQESQRLLSVDPEMIFLSNFGQSGCAAKTLRELGFKGRFAAALLDQTRIEQASNGLENAISGEYPESSDDFTEKFVKKYNQKPSVSSDTSYDALYALAHSIESVKSFDVHDVTQKLFDVKFQGASGLLKFDDKGGVIRTPHFVIVKNNQIIPLEE